MRAETERPTCATCPYWSEDEDEGGGNRGGWCHRYPPTKEINADAPHIRESLQPVTWFSDWCGEHPDFPAWIAATRPKT